jgi:glucose uptake protein GlcU
MSPRARATPISRSVVTVVLVIHPTIIPVMVGLSLIPPLLGGKILLVVRSKFGRVVSHQCLDKLGTVHEYPLSLWFQLRATSLFLVFLFIITQAKKV